ncbi:hypothetical protein RN001_010803 [Aquatica leii]|uniref:Uncharacterized protein n=1 Tax=Aquatica leii TaxID=1421715 RepID=A0AAN7SEP3_9COLE|nr:hypothetical protein RN001_010803 [Aquatica leii]
MAASLLIRNVLVHVKDVTNIPALLPDNFIRQILHHYRNNRTNTKDEEFHDEMTNFFDCLCKSLQRDQVDVKTKINVLKKIIFYPGSFMFENVTKSKNVQKLIRILDKEGVKKLSSLYRDVLITKKEKIVAPNVTEQWLNSERIYSAQLLAKLLTSPLVQDETQWKIKNLKLFIDVGICKHKYDNVGTELANNVKDVFFRALDLKFNKLEEVALVLYELCEYTVLSDCLRSPLTEEELEIFNQMRSVTTKLNAKKVKDECAIVFQVLFLHMGLQLFQDKDLAVSSLKELFSCYERVNRTLKEASDGDPEWIEVVVDLFLNLLSHNSLLLRNIVGSVFPYLCKYLTPSSMHQILSVLDPNDSNALSVNDSESESDEDDEVSDEEESDDDNETVNDKLRMAVQAALGGYQTDEESIDLDDMDDNDAETLDKALADAFRQFKPNRGKVKKQSKHGETLTHFRIRVLDLLEIYLDSGPGMLSCLEIMLPLLQVLEFSIRDDHQKPLLVRVRHCLRKLSNVKKFNSVEGITDTILGDLLSSLLEKGTKNSMLLQDMSNEISDCCVFIIKCAQSDSLPVKTKKRCQGKVIDILIGAINVYFKQRDCLIPYYLFKSVFQLHWEGNRAFAPLLFDFVFNDDIRPFRRNQALDLLKLFYSNRRNDDAYNKFLMSVAEHEKKLCDDVIVMLRQSREIKQVKEKFVSNLFSLLRAMLSHSKPNQTVDWKMLGDKIREFRSHVPLSRDAKVTYNQLCRALQLSDTKKRKVNGFHHEERRRNSVDSVPKRLKMNLNKSANV